MAAEYAWNKFRKYARRSWEYKSVAAPLILSQKNNQMPATGKRPRKRATKKNKTVQKLKDMTPVRKQLFKDPPKAFTPRGSANRVKFLGGLSSHSAGKLGTKRFKLTRKTRISSKGVTHTHEVGKVVAESGQCAWVGHNSAPFETVYYTMWQLIIKKLANKSGSSIRNFNDAADYVTPGDIFQVTFQSLDGAQGTVTHVVAIGNAWAQVVNTFATSGVLRTANVHLKYIAFIPITNNPAATADRAPVRLDLEYAMIDYYAKSSMKIQNRSQNSNVDAEAVDNVPLYGKSYGGSGNGVLQMISNGAPSTLQLLASSVTGLILGSSADIGQQEPPHAWYFPGAKRAGKIHLDPGYVKTSVLVHKKRISLNLLKKQLSDDTTSVKVKSGFGKFTFFAIEKMIQTSAPAENNILLGIEVNHFIAMNLYSRYRDVTCQTFTSSYV